MNFRKRKGKKDNDTEEKLEKAQREIESVRAQAELYKEELNKLKESKQ